MNLIYLLGCWGYNWSWEHSLLFQVNPLNWDIMAQGYPVVLVEVQTLDLGSFEEGVVEADTLEEEEDSPVDILEEENFPVEDRLFVDTLVGMTPEEDKLEADTLEEEGFAEVDTLEADTLEVGTLERSEDCLLYTSDAADE